MRRSRTGTYRGKRAVDLLLVAAAAAPAALLGGACAVAVRLSGPGPILYRQLRIGRDGRPFELLKFRTMVDRPDNPIFPDPGRITPVGRWLRRLSLDELPQLLNVVRGDMSLVGPRPALAYQVERYDERQRGRLAALPGVTGLAQVSGRNTLYWSERIELDLTYIRRQSIGLDLAILARTVRLMARPAGVEGHPGDDPIASVAPLDDPPGPEA
jgi:lipopolysaccharide/colanic/teichoic acid biosynthesis glycosyltransferase